MTNNMETTISKQTENSVAKNQDYNCTFTVSNSAEEIFDAISRVNEWWITNTEGSSKKLNDVFIIRFDETSFVTFKIVEMIPNKKVVWLVTDCYLPWFNDKKEWNNTKLGFEISKTETGTQMSMIHVGLSPKVECYEMCVKGWNFYAGESLRKLITEGKGLPDTPKSER